LASTAYLSEFLRDFLNRHLSNVCVSLSQPSQMLKAGFDLLCFVDILSLLFYECHEIVAIQRASAPATETRNAGLQDVDH